MDHPAPMMRIAAAAVAAGLLLLATGCTPAGPTGYRAMAGEYGYTSERTESGNLLVVFYANEQTPRERVQDYALYRAAELTRREGRTRFAVLEHGIGREVEQPSARDRLRESPPPGFEQPGAGFGRGDTTLMRDRDVPIRTEPRVRLKAELLIRPYDGAPPAGAERHYDAAQVLDELGPRIRSAPR
jgi:hypothetical protein